MLVHCSSLAPKGALGGGVQGRGSAMPLVQLWLNQTPNHFSIHVYEWLNSGFQVPRSILCCRRLWKSPTLARCQWRLQMTGRSWWTRRVRQRQSISQVNVTSWGHFRWMPSANKVSHLKHAGSLYAGWEGYQWSRRGSDRCMFQTICRVVLYSPKRICDIHYAAQCMSSHTPFRWWYSSNFLSRLIDWGM